MNTDRSKAREQALHILYQREITGAPVGRILGTRTWDVRPLEPLEGEEIPAFGEPSEFCRMLLEGVEEHQDCIDGTIESISENWSLSRMPLVDRNILRVAAYEILYVDDIPDSVSINEAVELAKTYGGEDSSKFVNGVLGRLAEEHRSESEACETPCEGSPGDEGE